MSSIRSAVSKIKNFFVSFVGQENTSEDGNPQTSSRLARGLFSSSGARKRPAANIYEPEITDDEDDFPGFSNYTSHYNPGIKRLRVESGFELEMASRKCSKPSSKYPTRRSGIPPVIEGLSRQPWEFSFPKSKRGTSHTATANSDAREIEIRIDESREPANTDARTLNVHSNPSTSKKNIEVITIDDETPSTSNALCVYKQPAMKVSPLKGRNQSDIMKPRVSSSMKSKPRDCNRFSRYLGNISRRIVGPSSAIRLNEKSRYKQLLMTYNVLNSKGLYESALTKTKVDQRELAAIYNKFGPSPTKGAVTFQFDGQPLSTSRDESKSLFSSPSCGSLVPKLFSTPIVSEPRGPFATSELKAIEYEKEPDIVDLEEESSQVESCISPITPVTTRRSYVSSTPIRSPLVGNFTNLEDALSNTLLPEEKDDPEEKVLLSLEDSQTPDNEDISILAEKIVNKSRSKSINTLALEQTLCPYVDKRWLDSSRLSWRENQKQREKRIGEESETLKILHRESTIDKDLEERIRKKLTLTEIIVLEEPPEQLPELTNTILAIISHAKARGNDNEVLAQVRLTKDTINITRGDLRTLGSSQWLNDNVINTYMGLIVLRSKNDNLPSVYAFQTFFYPKLLKEGYSNSLKRWTRKDDIFAHDLIILPIHLGLHWCLACIDLRKKTIRYFDSLGGDNYKCLNLLLEYITREMKERKQIDLDKSEWKLENVKGIPQQQNGSDCGMFSCKFAEFLSRDSKFSFTQEDMPYYRNRMIYELIKSDLLHP